MNLNALEKCFDLVDVLRGVQLQCQVLLQNTGDQLKQLWEYMVLEVITELVVN
jgi:hypothetical protein